MTLRSKDAFWHDSDIVELLKKDLKYLNEEELRTLVSELDRRFMQLWDKVVFEREHELVDYSKLNK